MISTSVVSEAGGGKNQDRALCLAHGEYTIVIVADGAGGMGGGALAAEIAVQYLRETAGENCALETVSPTGILSRLRALDLAIRAERNAGECAAVIAIIGNDMVLGASVGDCEAWVLGKGQPIILTENQIRKPLLGSGAANPIGFGPVPLTGTLVIGTDGLFRYARRKQIIEAETKCKERAHLAVELTNLARLPNGGLQDDTTLVVCSPR